MELSYERRGAGEPLVLIHGLGGSKRVWDPVLDLLAPERDVIAPDAPGAGRSPALPEGIAPSAANLGAEISGLCERLGVNRPHVAGNSLGAWIALEIAKAGRAASVCAISPAGLWRRPLGPRAFDAHRLARALRPLIGAAVASRPLRERLLATTMAHPEHLTRAEAEGPDRGLDRRLGLRGDELRDEDADLRGSGAGHGSDHDRLGEARTAWSPRRDRSGCRAAPAT